MQEYLLIRTLFPVFPQRNQNIKLLYLSEPLGEMNNPTKETDSKIFI